MPLIRNGSLNSSRLAELTTRLADEIRTASGAAQPIVYENEIAQTRTFHVTVIWDDWADLPLQARSRIILDAYEVAAPEKTGKITIAMGLTRRNATEMGLFPYSIIANVRRSDAPTREHIVQVMKKQGALESASGLELRFQTLEEAEAAVERLQQELPGPYWAIVQEVRNNT